MKKKCNICGAINIEEAKFCSNCGNSVENFTLIKDESINKNNSTSIDSKNGNKLGIISLILLFLSNPIVNVVLDSFNLKGNNRLSVLSGLFPIAGIVVLVVGRVKYPTNTLLKVVMWLFIIFAVLGIIYFVLFMALCVSGVKTCLEMDFSGCY